MQGASFEFNKTAYKMYNPREVVSRCPDNVVCDCNYAAGPQPQGPVNTPLTPYNMICYNMVLDITWFSVGSKMVI